MNDTPSEKLRIHLQVTGRVQKVGFRAYVQQVAGMLSLTGWVRNVGYDQVEAEAEGPRSALEAFILRVSEGPRGSCVDDLQVEWGQAKGEFTDFRVRGSL